MSNSTLDIYEQLFHAAQQDVRQMEKNANILGDGFKAVRRAVNDNAIARPINEFGENVAERASHGYQAFRGNAPTQAQHNALRQQLEQAQYTGGAQHMRANAAEDALNAQKAQGQGSTQLVRQGDDAAPSGVNPWVAAGLGTAGAGAAGTGAYMYGKSKGEDEGRSNRNMAFGAGLAAGSAAPPVFSAIGDTLSSLFGNQSAGPPPSHQ